MRNYEHDPLIILHDDPGNDSVHMPYSAFNQGWNAADDGIFQSLNPYPPESKEAEWWDYGFECHEKDES